MDLALVSASPFIMALIIPAIGPSLRRTLLCWGITAALTAFFVALLGHLSTGGAVIVSVPWVPALGLTLSIYLDGLSLLFALLITGIGALISLYAGYYFENLRDLIRFYQFMLMFMSGMLGLVLAGNLLMLFIAWEITSITSFFLIGFKTDDPEARRSALQALIITVSGGLAMLVGFILLGTVSGSFEIADILGSGATLRDHPYYTAIALLIFIGCFSKSAQVPFHFWLPGAMTAPTPASAYLHSATMVKAGIYLLLRLSPALGGTPLWEGALVTVGLLTMLVGALFALHQTDLKLSLAYSTVSQLGALVALIGLPNNEGLLAAKVGIVAHAMYKGALFMIVGVIDHAAGTRDLRKLGGLHAHLPLLTAITLLAGLSMAGLPPLLGFVAKERLLEAFQSLDSALPIIIVTLSALLTVAMAFILVWNVFFRPASSSVHIHAPALGLQLSPALLAFGSLVVGILIDPLGRLFLGNETPIALWNGFTTAFYLSTFAIVGGVALGWFWQRLPFRVNLNLPDGRTLYEGAIRTLERAADQVLRTQGGKLRYYLAAIITVVILLMATAGFTGVHLSPQIIQFTSSTDLLKVTLLGLTIGATFASILYKRHLIAALALGVAGYSVGGIFLLEPAPDVALVQFLVETLGTVLVIIMLGKISSRERQETIGNLWKQTRAGLGRDILIAVLVGTGVGLFSLAAVVNRPTRSTITAWHIENAEALVGSTDIVAAIVTDFRGMDTVIEITVFGMAALGVLTLLSTPEPGRTIQFTAGRVLQRLRARGAISREPTAAERESQDPAIQREIAALMAERKPSILSTPLTRTVATVLLPLALLISVSHILYGAGAPGDGFTAGVVSGLGVSVWYVVFGYDQAKRRLYWLRPIRLIGAGIGLAILNAAVPLILGEPFLTTTQFKMLWLPADIHLTSTSFFETGIFLAVLGGTALILETIAHPLEVETF